MATDYAGQYLAAHPGFTLPSNPFVYRMEMALVHNATNIYNEAPSTPLRVTPVTAP